MILHKRHQILLRLEQIASEFAVILMDISLFGELRYNYRSVYKILPSGKVAKIYHITVSRK
jgi:hypothetical protein